MDYKNLLIRTSITLIFLLIYIFLFLINYSLIFYLIIIFYFFIILEALLYFNYLKKTLLSYIIISLFSFILYYNFYFNIIEFNLLILTIINFDIFSYLVGSILGKKKIFKQISPNKTYVGLMGGILISNIISIIYILYFSNQIYFNSIIFINIVIIFAFIGDIIESFFKRQNNIKNSSNFLPGHGGFLDRFDSFIFAVIFLIINKFVFFI